MSDITIRKIKVIDGGDKLLLSIHEDGSVESDNPGKLCKNKCHPDLLKAFEGLRCHLAIQTDYITEKRAKDQDELDKFVVTGLSLGGSEDSEGVVITGYRKTKYGKTVTLNTPFLKIDSDPETYYLIEDLNENIETIMDEGVQYLGGKKAPDTQTSLPFPEEVVTKAQIAHPEGEETGSSAAVVNMESKPKRGRKKVAQTASVPSGEEDF